MIEETLNFGMNATQLSKISNLQSNVVELDVSLQNVLDNLDTMKEEELKNVEKQEKKYQREQEILKLREFIFNIKTQMEELHQSKELSTGKKYLQFRDICYSPILQALEPNYFETFEDKDYAVSIKRYLFKTRDELYDSLSDDIKSILREILEKEKQLEVKNHIDLHKPQLPVEPKIPLHKLRRTLKPVKPIGKEDTAPIQREQNIGTSNFFNKWLRAIFFNYNETTKINKYEKDLTQYHRDMEHDEHILQVHEAMLKMYKRTYQDKEQKYTNDLQKYNNHLDNISTLKMEITSLYQTIDDLYFPFARGNT